VIQNLGSNDLIYLKQVIVKKIDMGFAGITPADLKKLLNSKVMPIISKVILHHIACCGFSINLDIIWEFCRNGSTVSRTL
jgi:hypothetical protein